MIRYGKITHVKFDSVSNDSRLTIHKFQWSDFYLIKDLIRAMHLDKEVFSNNHFEICQYFTSAALIRLILIVKWATKRFMLRDIDVVSKILTSTLRKDVVFLKSHIFFIDWLLISGLQ